MKAIFYGLFTLWLTFFLHESDCSKEDEDPVQAPSLCEVCKFLTTELKLRLRETGSKDVIETGHGVEKKKKIKYQTSELRWIEALQEPHVCDKILEYNVHKEKKGSLRFAKGQSETMATLHGLVAKGVKVDLGFPEEMWDKPSAEVTIMQRQCFKMVEDYEDELEEWYFHHQQNDLTDYFCAGHILNKKQQECLFETESPGISDESKGDPGKKDEL